MSILLYVFERILPSALASTQLEPLRRALSKAIPGDLGQHMFQLAQDVRDMPLFADSRRSQMADPCSCPASCVGPQTGVLAGGGVDVPQGGVSSACAGGYVWTWPWPWVWLLRHR
jgi:hypothetical protein